MDERNNLVNSVNSLDSLNDELNYEKAYRRPNEETTVMNNNEEELHYEIKRLEFEKCKLQAALEESEIALEQEENKNLRVQLQLCQVRKETEDEFRADINDLQKALDQAKKQANSYKNIKRQQQELKDVQDALEEEQKARDDTRKQLENSERHANILQNKLEESDKLLEQAETFRKQTEKTLDDTSIQLNEVITQNTIINNAKKAVEFQLETIQSEMQKFKIDKSSHQIELTDFTDKLRAAQTQTQTQEKLSTALEAQVQALQRRINEGEKSTEEKIKKYDATIKQLEKNAVQEKEESVKLIGQNSNLKTQLVELKDACDELNTRLKTSHKTIIELKSELQEIRSYPEIRDEIYGNTSSYESKYKKKHGKISMSDITENPDDPDLSTSMDNYPVQLKLSTVAELEKELHKARILLEKSNRHSIKIVKELNDANEQLNGCPRRFNFCCM